MLIMAGCNVLSRSVSIADILDIFSAAGSVSALYLYMVNWNHNITAKLVSVELKCFS